MAPRGRSRKPRLTRMDAAIDAMTPFGFPEQLVRKTVKDLLKAYGGDVGWTFVEGDAYTPLIEAILAQPVLDEQETGDVREENLLPNEELRDERPGDSSVAVDPGPSTLSLPTISSEVAGAAARTFETGEGHLLIAEGHGEGGDSSGEGMQLDVVRNKSGEGLLLIAKGHREGGDSSGEGMQLDVVSSPPSLIPTPPLASGLPRRRKPCYGWISSDESGDEDDFIELTPAPRLMPDPKNTVGGSEKRRRLTSRWDVRP